MFRSKALCLLLLLGGPGCVATPGGERADLVLIAGKVLTVDSDFSVAQAIAIRGDRILSVGTNEEILRLRGPETVQIDLEGKTVIPGLIDNHYHMLAKAVDQYLGVEVALVESLDEMLDAIREKALNTPPGEVIYTTSGWLVEQLAEQRLPNKADLDSATSQHPVVVQGGHTLYLNSAALELAGINSRTPTPSGGTISKDPHGQPNGLLIDNAMSLARHLIPQATHGQKVDALKAAQTKENQVGITSVREPGISPQDMRAYQDLWEQGGLTLRVGMNLDLDGQAPAEELIRTLENWGVTTSFGDPWLRLDGIGEFGLDGGFEAALMSQPYERMRDGPAPADYFGLQRIPTPVFREVLLAANRLGWRASIHTVGDKAIDILLDVYEAANREKPIRRKRWLIEHAHYTRPDQFARIRELGVAISTQFHPYMSAGTMVHHWGQERAEQTMRLRDWLDAGLIVGGGSDWSLVPASPFWMIYFWVTRDTRLWDILGPEQAISREEALRVMTWNNAYLTGEEELKGSLEAGKLADLVVLDRDYLDIPSGELREILPEFTMVGGRAVFVSAKSILQVPQSIR